MKKQDWINNAYKISQLSDDYKDYYENCLEYINSLEQELSELKYNYDAQEIIIRDKTAFMEAMTKPKTCESCKHYNIYSDCTISRIVTTDDGICCGGIIEVDGNHFCSYYDPKK